MKTKALKKDSTVFWEGDAGDCMYYILWGKVGVYKNYATLHQKKLAELSSGDYFGEMGLIDGEPRSATAVVLEDGTRLDRIDESEFAQFLAENPAKVGRIIEQLSHKLRQTTKDYLEICRSVASAVGEEHEVDGSSNYHFEQDDHLRTIHDAQAKTADNA